MCDLLAQVIQLTKERLSPGLEIKLRRWLALPEAITLMRVISSQCQFCQADALAKALTATKGDQNDLLLQDEMREAARFNDFLRIFTSMQQKPATESFQIAKMIQDITINTANTNDEDSEQS